MSRADCVSGAKRRAILKLEAGVLEKNGTNEKGDQKTGARYLAVREMLRLSDA